MEYDKNCTVIINLESDKQPSAAELQKKLESSKETDKREALEHIILQMMHGEPHARLLMSVIRFVVTSNDHRIKKLLMLYWEIVDKCKPDGELKEEMILVCNALRNDLMHPNEFIRGSTLRLLCKVRYFKLLEPLVEPICRNLVHRHNYVRRNAVMCVYSLVKAFGADVIPHAPEAIEELLLVEGDLSTKRNAFLFLIHCAQERAVNYLLSVQDALPGLGDIFQLVLLELIRKVSRQKPAQKPALLRMIVSLVQNACPAVAYEGAVSLVTLSASPLALKAATQAYVTLLVGQSDNNVKLIVLDRLTDILRRHKHVLEGFVMDILRVLVCPSMDVRRKTIDIALKLVSPRNIKEVVKLLKKEVMKTMEATATSSQANTEYRRLLTRAIHASCARFPDVASSVIHLLMDFMSESDQSTTTEVVMFVRELVAKYDYLREPILQRIVESLGEIQQSRVLRTCLWLLGEFVGDGETLESALTAILTAVGPPPFLSPADLEKSKQTSAESPDDQTEGGAKSSAPKVKVTTRTVVLPDGTYGQENVYENATGDETAAEGPTGGTADGGAPLKPTAFRTLITSGDFLLSAMLAVSLAKLCLKKVMGEGQVYEIPTPRLNEVMLVVASLLKFVRDHPTGGAKSDAAVRIAQCVQAMLALLKKDAAAISRMEQFFFAKSRDTLGRVLDIEAENYEISLAEGQADTGATGEETAASDPSDLLVFRQLREVRAAADGLDDDDADLSKTVGGAGTEVDDSTVFQQRLARVQQMTGLADPVYVEAFLQVHQFDLVLELLVINRTQETLQNVNVELSTHGDLKLVDRPTAVNLAAGQSVVLKGSIKVMSTETGIVFGYVTFDAKGSTEKECLVLNEMHIDLLDYIERSWVGELAFRTMWSEFEWENKININTTMTDVGQFLQHIMKNTNMTVVGKYARPPAGISAKKEGGLQARLVGKESDDMDEYLRKVKDLPTLKRLTEGSSFFAVNLYSRSIFGEDALANLSIEKLPDGSLAGSVRIRSRTQGIALSLGDRITIVQRGSGSGAKK